MRSIAIYDTIEKRIKKRKKRAINIKMTNNYLAAAQQSTKILLVPKEFKIIYGLL